MHQYENARRESEMSLLRQSKDVLGPGAHHVVLCGPIFQKQNIHPIIVGLKDTL